MRLEENETVLTVNFEPISFKRIRPEMEFLAESGFFKLFTDEIVVNSRKKLQVKLAEIHLSIIH